MPFRPDVTAHVWFRTCHRHFESDFFVERFWISELPDLEPRTLKRSKFGISQQACVPFRPEVAAYVGGSDRLVKARDVLTTRSLVLLPVLSDEGGQDAEKVRFGIWIFARKFDLIASNLNIVMRSQCR